MRKIIAGVIGSLLVLLGTILLFIRGPGLLVIAAGLAVLSLDFSWARDLLGRIKGTIAKSKGPGSDKTSE
jgi:hypothetical protein